MYSVLFRQAEESSQLAGAKGMNLIKLTKHGLPVPDGFIIQTNALARFMEDNQLHDSSENIENAITAGTFSDEIKNELTSSFYELRESYHSVAVRSSSASEDLEGASFAGQYETYLNIKTEEEFLNKVKECWASFFSGRVSRYKKKMNNQIAEPLMGVVVQGLINSDISGVIFSQNPVTHDDRELLISASYGLGEAVVSGSVTPDTYIVHKGSFEIQKEMGLKEIYMESAAEGIAEKETSEDMRSRFCLTDEQVIELTELTKKTEALYGYPVDLEFGIADHKLYLLQARPITTIEQDKKAAEEERNFMITDKDMDDFWLNMESNIEGPVSPLFSSFIVPALEYGLKKSMRQFPIGVIVDEVKVYRGHIYSKNQGGQQLPAEDSAEELFPVLSERMYDIIHNTYLPFYRTLDQLAQTEHTPESALDAFKKLKSFYLTAYEEHFNIVFPQILLTNKLQAMYQNIQGETENSHFYEMLTGVMNKSLETDRRLWQFSVEVRENPNLTALFEHAQPEHLQERLEQTDEGRQFLQKANEFLQEYGWRSVKSHDLIEQTWAENPFYALTHIQNYVRNGYHFDNEFKKTIKKREKLYNEFFQSIEDPALQKEFERYYQWTLNSSNIKDDHHFYIDAMLDAKARVFLLKVGELLAESGVIQDREDLWFLYDDEVENALLHPVSLQEKAEKRRQMFHEYELAQAPAYLGTPTEAQLKAAEEIVGAVIEDEKNTENDIFGVAASSGIATGPVKVIRDASEFSQFTPGDILVCKMTTPLWTSLFQDAKAIITDTGGILSHAAIIAREYGIPAVLGTRAATERLRDGDIVTVDGNSGKITVVSRS
ncbi:phosphotransferase [Bacillus mojavensis]|uniref:PEP/pyruvate-binding domain-containing protein n=1 Tax=Bacillus mojavensis TaxID=72360 RepID=UPI000288BE04|nr:PEP/pyruvate-binding domain-containing protein [Bacillus mojavensis]MDR4227897.1 phosphotransferase [Bacillus mojavensis]MEC3586431.1 PEP/pyruvate-binding domain-containing protein [Bacillus mojavensis]MEC5242879.1 PEP/pyruvate-binding domain-containing protein [Bacillus mojavensis]MED0749394.1 PEP/pyruvate-binding domain-containing protein [Bacillus mojavensis]